MTNLEKLMANEFDADVVKEVLLGELGPLTDENGNVNTEKLDALGKEIFTDEVMEPLVEKEYFDVVDDDEVSPEVVANGVCRMLNDISMCLTSGFMTDWYMPLLLKQQSKLSNP